jgi:hypothetical protein
MRRVVRFTLRPHYPPGQESRDSSVGILTRLRAGRSGVRIPVGGEIFTFPKCPYWLWGPPSLIFNGCREFLSLGKEAISCSWTPRVRMCGGIPLLPLYTFLAWTETTLAFYVPYVRRKSWVHVVTMISVYVCLISIFLTS